VPARRRRPVSRRRLFAALNPTDPAATSSSRSIRCIFARRRRHARSCSMRQGILPSRRRLYRAGGASYSRCPKNRPERVVDLAAVSPNQEPSHDSASTKTKVARPLLAPTASRIHRLLRLRVARLSTRVGPGGLEGRWSSAYVVSAATCLFEQIAASKRVEEPHFSRPS